MWGQIDSLEQEMELLHNAPPSPKSVPLASAEKDADLWRLDTPQQMKLLDGRGPLLDQSGKVIAEPISLLLAS